MCKLLKSLYGLKQIPKQWHEKFNETLLVDGFSSSDVDRCVYTKSVNNDHVIICLYVDDMFIFGTCSDIVFKIKSFLAYKFDVKDMGEASVILGVKIEVRIVKRRLNEGEDVFGATFKGRKKKTDLHG